MRLATGTLEKKYPDACSMVPTKREEQAMVSKLKTCFMLLSMISDRSVCLLLQAVDLHLYRHPAIEVLNTSQSVHRMNPIMGGRSALCCLTSVPEIVLFLIYVVLELFELFNSM